MTPEAMRIAIAEACGWKRIAKPEYEMQKVGCATIKLEWWDVRFLPEFCTDLNAMHEALRFLCKKKHLKAVCNMGLDGTWECVLTESETPNCIPCDGDHFGCGDTLSIAMAEVFLRTIGKWVEE